MYIIGRAKRDPYYQVLIKILVYIIYIYIIYTCIWQIQRNQCVSTAEGYFTMLSLVEVQEI